MVQLRSAVLATVAAAATAAGGRPLTLVEHEYGLHHVQIDDGTPFAPVPQVPRDDPTFALGHFLIKEAEGPEQARCLDGTPAVYYHRPGTGTGVDKWYVHQQGGGWCYDLESCVQRAGGTLGSTKADPKNRSLDGGYFAVDPAVNPLMYNWNAIYIRYCDGASVSGDKATPTVVDNTTLHFRGRALLDAEIKSIIEERGMDHATDVVVSGCSAGGLATFLHCDHWASAISKATDDNTKVVCMPDSGFFLDEEREPKYKCIFAQWTSEHIKTPTFPLQSQYDSWQRSNVMGPADDDTQNEFGRNLTGLVETMLLAQPQHGVFLDSCQHHCGAWDGPVIDGLNSGQALEAWYTNGSAGLANKGFFNQAKTFPCKECCHGPGR